MGRPSNKAQRQQEITHGLMQVMAQQGYDKASIQLIAKAAGLSSGLIHYHFKSKQAILVTLINDLNNQAQGRFQEQIKTATRAQDKLNAYIDAALALGNGSDESAVSAWVTISAEAIRQTEVRTLYQEIVAKNQAQLISLLNDYAKERQSSLNKSQLKELASLMLATIEGCYQMATTAHNLMPRGFAAKTLKAMVKSYC